MAKTIKPSSAHHSQGFITFLASVLLEWLLMLLLFAHAVFYHLIMKFARYYNLPLPCLLCSRLDKASGKKKEKHFQDLFCGNHKSEISSLVLCRVHYKLVDVRKMCETCLFSFATFNKSNSETYRLLVGKLADDSEDEFEESQGKKKHVNKMRRCSCCNERWRPKSYQRDLLRICSVNHEASRSDTQFPLDNDCADTSEVKRASLENTIGAVRDSQPELKKDTDLQSSSKSLEFGDAYNRATSNERRQISSSSFKERNVTSSAKISEDLKQLLSQISLGTDLPSFDMSPRLSSRNLDDLKHLDSNTTGTQMLQKNVTFERNESLDGSAVNMEGLKRQIEHDKKLLLTLYKELEEERSASAIATNQAMAMITRLQEEKAALHMDASQYLRMMEEQAEYDTEALQNCNDLLSDKEMEIQALETELEHYRNKYPEEAALFANSELCFDSKEKDFKVERSECKSLEDRGISRSFSNPKNVESLRISFKEQMRNSLLKREIDKNSFTKRSEGSTSNEI